MISIAPLTLLVALVAQPVEAQVGVNIHFTGAPQRDLDLIQEAGFGWVRMDLAWQAVERVAGEYQFEAYDQLVAGLAERGIRALFILDYSNSLYEPDQSVRSAEGRAAFARFAAAAAARYRGRGVCWEIWNEPNLDQFWHPQPAERDYLALVSEVVPAIRAADPQAKILAPATSRFPWPFLDFLCAGGLLGQIDQLSVHPYRAGAPETATADYQRLRELIRKYTPAGSAPLPIVSGEWGYSNWHQGKPFPRERQAAYLARQFLNNIAAGVQLSIWYDWCDDGPDPHNTEHNFGAVTQDRAPKPAFRAMKTLSRMIGKMVFERRLDTPDGDHALLFRDPSPGKQVLVVWTEDRAHTVRLAVPGIDKTVAIVGMTGTQTETETSAGTLELELQPAPSYVELPAGVPVQGVSGDCPVVRPTTQ
ncbi:MAG: hypothetical protein A2W31_13170 [Planctomycetes bacterium RBG_16_64_10]|nr:MAG: hypothetical protein A2W31_13170 [Planctomycetes bacterium RBG_16_64_10]